MFPILKYEGDRGRPEEMIKCVCVRLQKHTYRRRLPNAGSTTRACVRGQNATTVVVVVVLSRDERRRDQRKTPKQLIRGLINHTTLANSTTAAAAGHYAHVLSAHFNCTRAAALFMTTWPTIQGRSQNCERERRRCGAKLKFTHGLFFLRAP